ncbi:RtcB family protein [Nocardia sp. NPDC051990]|uniref:RtcB family protein n=1 Tax=Nocardia sp. NPDC051990 TaxID=3155285 RepID=UPI003442213F
MELIEETPFRFRIERHGDMRVPGLVFASRALAPDIAGDKALEQVVNVATLPGIVLASYAMPDVHWGYGFPIGGVAATDIATDGVVSPGGVGFDISCGVRLLAADLDRATFASKLTAVMDDLDAAIPRGFRRGGLWQVSRGEFGEILTKGAAYAIERGHGVPRDLRRCEDQGRVDGADPDLVSDRAVARGLGQVGSLGSGNHFLEVQAVAEIYDEPTANAFGLHADQVCVMIHCGSRGLGHQICGDHLRLMEPAMRRYGIEVPDRQLACAPVHSPEGQDYLAAMAAATNYARANRQLLAEAVRRIILARTGAGLDLVYDVSHNLAAIETHDIDGRPRLLCVHRKGATRALPPGHPDVPADLTESGQPTLIPGTMGTASFVCTGVENGQAFHSTCHGAGRVWSRHAAARNISGKTLRADLERQGIAVRGLSWKGLAEEAPAAYKDITAVAAASEGAGLCRTVARLVPLGVIKG